MSSSWLGESVVYWQCKPETLILHLPFFIPSLFTVTKLIKLGALPLSSVELYLYLSTVVLASWIFLLQFCFLFKIISVLGGRRTLFRNEFLKQMQIISSVSESAAFLLMYFQVSQLWLLLSTWRMAPWIASYEWVQLSVTLLSNTFVFFFFFASFLPSSHHEFSSCSCIIHCFLFVLFMFVL